MTVNKIIAVRFKKGYGFLIFWSFTKQNESVLIKEVVNTTYEYIYSKGVSNETFLDFLSAYDEFNYYLACANEEFVNGTGAASDMYNLNIFYFECLRLRQPSMRL